MKEILLVGQAPKSLGATFNLVISLIDYTHKDMSRAHKALNHLKRSFSGEGIVEASKGHLAQIQNLLSDYYFNEAIPGFYENGNSEQVLTVLPLIKEFIRLNWSNETCKGVRFELSDTEWIGLLRRGEFPFIHEANLMRGEVYESTNDEAWRVVLERFLEEYLNDRFRKLEEKAKAPEKFSGERFFNLPIYRKITVLETCEHFKKWSKRRMGEYFAAYLEKHVPLNESERMSFRIVKDRMEGALESPSKKSLTKEKILRSGATAFSDQIEKLFPEINRIVPPHYKKSQMKNLAEESGRTPQGSVGEIHKINLD